MLKRILFLLILTGFGCEDLLFHEENNQFYTIDSDEEIEQLVNGIYYQLTKVYNEDYLEIYGRSDDIHHYMNYTFSVPGNRCSSSGYSLDYAQISGNIYLHFYKAIVVINRLLPVIEEDINPSLLGELYFLRAFCYFQLARLFGTPPLVEDIEVNYLIEKPDYAEVYDFIEEDMIRAMELLPELPQETRIPHESPHLGTAKALRAEICLAMGGFPLHREEKYAEAARWAEEVIADAELYNYRLLDDLANLWKAGEYRHNTECVYGLFYNSTERGGGNRIGRSNYIDDPWSAGHVPISGDYSCDFMFFDNFPDSYRKYNSFITGRYLEKRIDTLGGYESFILFKPYDPVKDPCSYVSGATTMKWIDLDEARFLNTWNPPNNVTLYLMRYAHVLLTYAEARVRSGNLDASCFEVVNMIRRRANNTDIYTPGPYDLDPGLSPEQFLDSVVWERAWELCTEPMGRWFDIIRLDLRTEIEANRYPGDKLVIIDEELLNEDWYFFLIPQEDRWMNPNYGDE